MKQPISIIVPLFNEAENAPLLCEQISSALEKDKQPYEIILVNDGSQDDTEKVIAQLASTDERIRVLTFRHNFGQTAALMAGFDHAEHDIIVAMDGDLQNDPEDIPVLLDKLEEGFDVVSGWRKNRQDDKIKRNLVSRVANLIISKMSGVELHDYGCTLKAYRKSVMEGVRLYGEMHRFIPIYAKWRGARVCEIPVNHRKREFGVSKYGLNRIFKVILDLMLVKFLMDYNTKPIHVFGAFGFVCFAISFASGLLAVYLRLFNHVSFIQTPLPLLVVMTFITGVLCILLGLLAELLVRIYYESQDKKSYLIKSYTNFSGTK